MPFALVAEVDRGGDGALNALCVDRVGSSSRTH